ncbi:MAG: hypothetical protein NC218_09360 [Acetobacter sp.]|nr:hypothetical protein [Acetobacter sp.]
METLEENYKRKVENNGKLSSLPRLYAAIYDAYDDTIATAATIYGRTKLSGD